MNRSALASQIEVVLLKYDPECLVGGYGAPRDEYRNEALEICSAVCSGQLLEDVTQVVTDVFHRNFDYVYKLAKYPGLSWCKHALLLCKDGRSLLLDTENTIEERAINNERLPLIEKAAKDIHALLRFQ